MPVNQPPAPTLSGAQVAVVRTQLTSTFVTLPAGMFPDALLIVQVWPLGCVWTCTV